MIGMKMIVPALFWGLAASGIPSGANACPLPLGPYDPKDAVAAVTATVTNVRGQGLGAIYSLRRTAIVWARRDAGGLPDRLEIRMADFVKGTCGSQSPGLRNGDRIVLYFIVDRGVRMPTAWKKL